MSWSFRKDCVGFARSMWDSGKSSVIVSEVEDDETLEHTLCILIGYFVSTVSSDVDEWLTWGVPYVDICVGALNLNPSLTGRIRDRFLGTVGRGYLFVFEDEKDEGQENTEETDGWTHVTPLSSFLNSLGDKLATYEQEKGVQAVLDEFLQAMQTTVSQGKYDTRTRVLISRRICHMFQLHSQNDNGEFTSEVPEPDDSVVKQEDLAGDTPATTNTIPIEQVSFQESLLSNLSVPPPAAPRPKSSTTTSYTSYFFKDKGVEKPNIPAVPPYRTTVQPQQVASAVNSFRALKIGIAAASGGALMFCAGGLAAPSIIASILASLTGITGASTTSAILMEMCALLNTYGLTLIASASATLGTGVASWKMRRRTDPLKEFSLEMLHSPHTTDLSKNTVLIASPEGYRRDADVKNDARASTTASLKLFRRLLPHDTRNSSVEQTPKASSADVVYMLVPGHFPEYQDLREMWGGDMDIDVDDDTRLGAGIRVSVRPASSLTKQKDIKEDKKTTTASDGQDIRNIRRGWWSELAVGHTSSVGLADCATGGEPYIVRWDTNELNRLYHAQKTFILEKGVSMAVEEVIKYASPVIGAASLPLSVLERAAELDCPWLVVMDRAEQAGRLLAALLLENASAPKLASDTEHQQYRQRTVNLIGYGFGARVIVYCLMLLSDAPDNSGLGIVQDVVLIGTPVSSSTADWLRIRRVVSGRLVNCFKTDDWMLGLMYRCKSWEVGIAGLAPIRLVDEEITTTDKADENLSLPIDLPQPVSHESKHLPREDSRKHFSSKKGISINLRRHDPAWRNDIENIDVSDIVSSHLMYGEYLQSILARVGIPSPGI